MDPSYRQKKNHAAILAGINREQIEAVTDEKPILIKKMKVKVGKALGMTPETRGPRTEPLKFTTGLQTNTTYNPIP